MRLIIGISGASGSIYGIRLLETLKEHSDVETHLVVTATGRMNIGLETDWKVNAVEALADFVHRNNDVGATIASGSFQCDGMIVAPMANPRSIEQEDYHAGEPRDPRVSDAVRPRTGARPDAQRSAPRHGRPHE